MFRTVPVSIIRSFSLYTQQWYVFYRFADSLRSAGSGRRYAVTVGPNEVGCLHWGRQCPVYKMHISLWIQGDRHCVGIELHSLICKIIIKALDKSVSVYTLLHGTCFISLIHLVLLNLLKGSRCAPDVTVLCSRRHWFVLPSQPCSQLAELYTTWRNPKSYLSISYKL